MLVFLVNPCDSSPCKNGGTCENDEDSFTCNVLINLKVLLVKKKVCHLTIWKVKSHIRLENI